MLLFICAPAFGEPAPKAVTFFPIESLAELDRTVKNTDCKPTLLRVRAAWDITDAAMDKNFTSASVQKLLAGVVLLEVDVTDNTAEHRELLAKYEVFGPPWILFFDQDGEHIVGKDIAGYQTPKRFEKHLRDALEQ